MRILSTTTRGRCRSCCVIARWKKIVLRIRDISELPFQASVLSPAVCRAVSTPVRVCVLGLGCVAVSCLEDAWSQRTWSTRTYRRFLPSLKYFIVFLYLGKLPQLLRTFGGTFGKKTLLPIQSVHRSTIHLLILFIWQ